MKCARCDADTSVVDSRHTPDNFMRRRRECVACGHRFSTWESRYKPDRRDRTEYFRARYLKKKAEAPPKLRSRMDPAARIKRITLRKAARIEAKKTGEPVAAIYARWGVG